MNVARRKFLLLASLAAQMAALARSSRGEAAGELVIVLHSKNTESPSLSEVKRIFVGDTTFWPGNVSIHPIVRPADTPAGEAFFHAIRITPSRFRRLWQERQLSGKGVAPETILPPAAMLAKVATDVGAIAFATSDEIPSDAQGVRVLLIR